MHHVLTNCEFEMNQINVYLQYMKLIIQSS
jgi:hypothetical protein